MRQGPSVSVLLLLALGCRPVSHTAATARTDGRIPITTTSDAARAAYLRGRALNENLQVHEAHAAFREAVAADPQFALGEYGLAATAPTAREITAHLERALALAAAHASPGEQLMIRGLQARRHGDPASNRVIADSLVVRYPNDARAHWILAYACSAQQAYDRAISEFRTAIALDTTYALAWNQLGYTYRAAGRMTDAEGAFRQYIALVPGDPNPYDSYAELLMKMGRFDESIAQYRKAQAIDAHFTGAFVGIAGDEMLAGRHDAARAELGRYLAMARDDYERRTALLTLAMVHVDAGATDSALDAMERRHALARAIGDTVSMSGDGVIIGDILLEAGRTSAARTRYAQAHALLAASSAAAEVRQDDALAAHHDAARIAIAMHDLPVARTEAAAYLAGATARRNDARVRQAHELLARLALEDVADDAALRELALADQQSPVVWSLKARAYAGRGDAVRARDLADGAVHMNILPSFAYVFTRASHAAATRSATSGSAGGTPR